LVRNVALDTQTRRFFHAPLVLVEIAVIRVALVRARLLIPPLLVAALALAGRHAPFPVLLLLPVVTVVVAEPAR
jgi:hypothetical protein